MKNLIVLILVLFCKQVFAEALTSDAPERKQLIAMGYEIEKEEKGDTFTIATIGSTRIVFSKNEDRLAITRYFNRERKLNQTDEMEIQRIINSFNEKYAYQFSYNKESLTSTLYIFGSYEPKTFAKVVRLMDKVNVVFDSEPNFFKLVNN
jgi:hypothetical protein